MKSYVDRATSLSNLKKNFYFKKWRKEIKRIIRITINAFEWKEVKSINTQDARKPITRKISFIYVTPKYSHL